VTHEREHHSPPLPVSYKVTIVVSVTLMFIMGLFYFTLRNQRVQTSFQVYGPSVLQPDLPAAFRVFLFDNAGDHRHLPVRVLNVALLQKGQILVHGPGEQKIASVPAEFSVDCSGLGPGNATLRIEVETWNSEQRTLELEIPVATPDGNQGLRFSLKTPVAAPIDEDEARLDLTMTGSGLVEQLPNRLWLRIADGTGQPTDVTATFQLGTGEVHQTARTGRLGLAPLTIAPYGLNQNLVIDAQISGGSVHWEEMIAPDRRFALYADTQLLSTPTPFTVQVEVRSEPGVEEVFCTFWRHETALSFHHLEITGGATALDLDVPAPGLYWVTCDDHFMAGQGAQAYLPLVVTTSPSKFLKLVMNSLSADEHIQAWPSPGDWSDAEQKLATEYLVDRLAPAGQELQQLLNTYSGDVTALQTKAGTQRDVVLILIGLVGLGLLFWAVGVAIQQHRNLSKSFKEFQEGEDVGKELAAEGLTRRQSYLPAIMVILTVIANVAALIWLLRLVFF
jgi:hypothetical protein